MVLFFDFISYWRCATCDCKQIGKFLYSIIMSEVKVGNIIAKKSVPTETSDAVDSSCTFVR